MEQLTLGLSNRLAYAASNFHVHAGVTSTIDDLLTLFRKEGFSIGYLTAPARRGKTHLSLYLVECLLRGGFLPKIIEGSDFGRWISESLPGHIFSPEEVLIVDDAHLYFSEIVPGASGPFVNLIETLRGVKAGILFLSSVGLSELPCDEHVKSRLIPGDGFTLGDPDEGDMEKLISTMARQRGIHLTDLKVEFLVRRLRRDIPSIEEYFGKLSHLSQVLGKSVKFPLLSDAI